jgi:thiamine-phosphate pyrophosphorylase
MPPRQPLPRLWLMTDERQDDGLFDALNRLPRGAGVVFRHYSLEPAARRGLFEQVRRIARRRGLLVLLAGEPKLARVWGADGNHGIYAGPRGLMSASVHNLRELRRAERAGADLLFASPVFPTRSHPGGRTLGTFRFGQLIRHTRTPVIALGGITPKRTRALMQLGAYGWAGIDAWASGRRIRT